MITPRYEELLAAGLQPDLVTVNTLLKSCMRCNDADRAALLWSDMQARGVDPDTYTLNMLIKVHGFLHCSAHCVVLCHPVCMYIPYIRPCQPSTQHPQTFGYCHDVNSLDAMHASMHAALEAASAATHTTQPSPWLEADVWGSLVVAYGSVGHTEAAWSAWRSMRSVHPRIPLSTSLCNAVMIVCVKAHQVTRVLLSNIFSVCFFLYGTTCSPCMLAHHHAAPASAGGV